MSRLQTISEQEAWQLSNDAAIAYERDFVPAVFAQWPPILAKIAGIGPGDRVLDVGCGTGVLAREASARVAPAGKVIGLDLNERMLAVARRLRPEIEWRQGNAARLPFADGSFDVVASQFMLMFLPDRVAALREMWRVLAPGGRLSVVVCAAIGENKGYLALAEILRRQVSDAAAAMVEGYFSLGDEVELARLANAAKISGAEVLTRQGWARFGSIDELLRIEIKGSPLAELVDAPAFERVRTEASQALRAYCGEAGRIVLPFNVRILAARKA